MQCYWLSRLVVIEGFEFECINEVVDVYIAINRRACVVPAKDVPDRRPRRNCNCWFDLGCSRIEVGSNGLTVYLHVVVTRPFFFQQFHATTSHVVQDAFQSCCACQSSCECHRR